MQVLLLCSLLHVEPGLLTIAFSELEPMVVQLVHIGHYNSCQRLYAGSPSAVDGSIVA
jgi:hypothetical protein